jgi:hypothetical protein
MKRRQTCAPPPHISSRPLGADTCLARRPRAPPPAAAAAPRRLHPPNASASAGHEPAPVQQQQQHAALDAAQPGDVLRARLPDGSSLYLEVTRRRRQGGGVEALCEGELVSLPPGGVAPSHAGYWPRLSDAWVKACPGLQAALKEARARQERGGGAARPSALLRAALEVLPLTSLAELEAQVAADPGPWCDGAAPGDAAPSEAQAALLSAGELAAFLQGRRGVALVQLRLGFDPGVRPPLLRPLVLRLLQRAAGARGAAALPSAAAGGAAASLVLAARRAPFRQWGAHLAGVGVQAALVADSPFYKVLIGRVLGYKLENIVHHVEVREAGAGGRGGTGGRVEGLQGAVRRGVRFRDLRGLPPRGVRATLGCSARVCFG